MPTSEFVNYGWCGPSITPLLTWKVNDGSVSSFLHNWRKNSSLLAFNGGDMLIKSRNGTFWKGGQDLSLRAPVLFVTWWTAEVAFLGKQTTKRTEELPFSRVSERRIRNPASLLPRFRRASSIPAISQNRCSPFFPPLPPPPPPSGSSVCHGRPWTALWIFSLDCIWLPSRDDLLSDWSSPRSRENRIPLHQENGIMADHSLHQKCDSQHLGPAPGLC